MIWFVHHVCVTVWNFSEMEDQADVLNTSDLITAWLNLLDFIQSECLSCVLDTMESHPHDLGIQTEARRILFFFFDTDSEIESM